MAHATAGIAGQRNAADQKQQQQLPLFTLMQVCIALLVASSCLALPTAVQAKHLDGAHHFHAHHELQQQQQEHHAHHRRRLQRDSTSKILNTREQCNSVRDYFETIDIKLSGNFEEKASSESIRCSTRWRKPRKRTTSTPVERPSAK